MSSHALRIFAAHTVPLLAMVIFSMNICGQESVEAGLEDVVVIGCRDTPSGSTAVSLEVTKAWVEGDALFGDLLVSNYSESTIRLPRENPSFYYWQVTSLQEQVLENPNVRIVEEEDGPVVVIEVIARDDNEPFNNAFMGGGCPGLPPIRYLSEVVGMLPSPLKDLIAEKDIESIAPGQTVLLRAVHLESFQAEPPKPKHEVRFEVRYRGWSKTAVLASTAEWFKEPLAQASAHHCSLYGGELKGNGHFLMP